MEVFFYTSSRQECDNARAATCPIVSDIALHAGVDIVHIARDLVLYHIALVAPTRVCNLHYIQQSAHV